MEHEDPRRYTSTTYLDIDGVIFPCENPLLYAHSRNPNASLERVWLNEYEYYYPGVVEALSEATDRSLVALSSSRQERFMCDPSYQDLIGRLGIAAALHIDYANPMSIQLKSDAVRRHWGGVPDDDLYEFERNRGKLFHPLTRQPIAAEGGRALWVDDHIMQLSYHDVCDIERDGTMTLMAPYSPHGLTLEDVSRIRRVLKDEKYRNI